MQQDLSEIVIVLDESGSMDDTKSATIEGINSFIREQRKVPGRANWTLTTFSGRSRNIFRGRPQADVPELNDDTYQPDGGTALIDAVCEEIDATGTRLAAMTAEQRPGKVIFVIMTDGQENCSRRFSKFDMLKRIQHQQDKYNWKFVFLGANQDAIATATSYGIKGQSSGTYQQTDYGTQLALCSVSNSIASYRSGQKDDVYVPDLMPVEDQAVS